MVNQEINKLLETEQVSFSIYLKEKQVPIELIRGEIGQDCLDNFILGLAVMEKYIGDAREIARQGDLNEAGYILGAGAKVTKDQIYHVLTEAYDGLENIFRKCGITSNAAVLRDYVMTKYDGGVKQVEFMLASKH